MIYMLLPGHRSPGGPGMAMPGMGAAASRQGFPVLAVILTLFMLGYIVWTTDRLTSRTAQPTTSAWPDSPRLAACAKIAMSLTMGYMLILMI